MTNDVVMIDNKNEKLLKNAFIFSIISVASTLLISGLVGIVFAILALILCNKVKKAGVTEQNYAKLTYTRIITTIGIIMSAYTLISLVIMAIVGIIIGIAIILLLPIIIVVGGIALIISGLGSVGTLLLPFLTPFLEELIMMILTGLAEAIIKSILSEIGLATFLMLI